MTNVRIIITILIILGFGCGLFFALVTLYFPDISSEFGLDGNKTAEMIQNNDANLNKEEKEWDPCKEISNCLLGKVTEIVDGDTLSIDNIRVRLSLVDTPERNMQGYKQASDFTASICPLGSIAIMDEDDLQLEGSYDRKIGTVYCNGDTVSLNEHLINSGHAKIIKRFCSNSEFANEIWAINDCK